MVRLRFSAVPIGASALLLSLSILVATFAFAADTPPIVGNWIGTLPVGQQGLRIALHINRDAAGDLTASIDSPDQNAFDLAGDKVFFKGGQLSFKVRSVNAGYWGNLSPDGKTITGIWIQGSSLRLEFSRKTHFAEIVYVVLGLFACFLLYSFLRSPTAEGFRSWRWRWVAVAVTPIAIAAILLAAGVAYEKIGEARDARNYPPPGKLVDVNGLKLHLFCTGTGMPVVVLETGSGVPSSNWLPVQNQLAPTTEVCVYDRPGLGWSQPSPTPLSMEDQVKDLHTLLSNAGIAGPYIMVGHSYGGALVRLFVKSYPSQVAGVVLVESVEEGFTYTPVSLSANREGLASMRENERKARFGLFRFRMRRVPADAAVFSTPRYFQATHDEIESMVDAPAEMRVPGGFGKLGDLPLIVIRRGKRLSGNQAVTMGMTSEQLEQSWKEGQLRLAALSENSELVVAESSEHGVPFTQPSLVADEIDRVVDAVRRHIPVKESYGTQQ
jgi:pimeloyl-ACP methyl ester carboxylesterase